MSTVVETVAATVWTAIAHAFCSAFRATISCAIFAADDATELSA
jgi:hypothetical protein